MRKEHWQWLLVFAAALVMAGCRAGLGNLFDVN